MADNLSILDLLLLYTETTPDCVRLMEKWQKDAQEYKENAEFDNLADEYFGK